MYNIHCFYPGDVFFLCAAVWHTFYKIKINTTTNPQVSSERILDVKIIMNFFAYIRSVFLAKEI
jgi:hypothetical protein